MVSYWLYLLLVFTLSVLIFHSSCDHHVISRSFSLYVDMSSKYLDLNRLYLEIAQMHRAGVVISFVCLDAVDSSSLALA